MKIFNKIKLINPIIIIILILLLIFIFNLFKEPASHPAGIRVSFNGLSNFPTKQRLEELTYNMSSQVKNGIPTLVLIVGGLNRERKNCHLYFPSSKSYKNMEFDTEDSFESYLSFLDTIPVKVFLQVEPANASVSDLIDVVLSRYKHHPSVIGFGTDIEWFGMNEKHPKGRPVSNKAAKHWEKKVKSHNPNYRLFLKHWETEKMPTTYRGDIIFVNDSQNYPSKAILLSHFKKWSDYFSDNPVFYQFGYKSDQKWWKKMANPPKEISEDILKIRKDAGIFWVDFTIKDLEKNYGW